MNVRPAAVAGSFYPADPVALRQQLQALLAARAHRRRAVAKPRALIVPHAGYRYSGATAAAAYACLHADDYRQVLLLGPAHRVPLRGMAFPAADAFTTPLGAVPIAPYARALLQRFPYVQIDDDAHAEEHALEVQLPFLQACLGQFELLPLLVGECPAAQVAAVIETLWDVDTLLVLSSDLSHFHPDQEARERDENTIAQILALAPTLTPEQACGAMPLNGLLHVLQRHPQQHPQQNAQQHTGQLQLLAADNSGDHGGPRQRVVGYASFRLD